MGVRHQRFLELAAELDLPHAACRKFDRGRQRLNESEVSRLEALILKQRQLTRNLAEREAAEAPFKCDGKEMSLGSFREGRGFPSGDLEAVEIGRAHV